VAGHVNALQTAPRTVNYFSLAEMRGQSSKAVFQKQKEKKISTQCMIPTIDTATILASI
jgi:hypothetical protein